MPCRRASPRTSTARTCARGETGALLTGRIVDDRGNPMSPSHTTKKGVRYRYYVSSAVVQGRSHEAVAVKRLAAHEVETIVMAALRKSLPQDATPDGINDAELIKQVDLRAHVRVGSIELTWAAPNTDHPRNAGTITHAEPDQEAREDPADAERQRLVLSYSPQPHKRRRAIIVPDAASGPVRGIREEAQRNLLRALAKGRALLQEIVRAEHVDLDAIAKREGRSERSIRATLSLAFLDPRLVRAAIDGTLPRGISAKHLVDLPPHWPEQWRMLGLPQPG